MLAQRFNDCIQTALSAQCKLLGGQASPYNEAIVEYFIDDLANLSYVSKSFNIKKDPKDIKPYSVFTNYKICIFNDNSCSVVLFCNRVKEDPRMLAAQSCGVLCIQLIRDVTEENVQEFFNYILSDSAVIEASETMTKSLKKLKLSHNGEIVSGKRIH